jgi:hypothetical protein
MTEREKAEQSRQQNPRRWIIIFSSFFVVNIKIRSKGSNNNNKYVSYVGGGLTGSLGASLARRGL